MRVSMSCLGLLKPCDESVSTALVFRGFASRRRAGDVVQQIKSVWSEGVI